MDFIRIVDLLRCLQLLLCGGQRLFIFSDRLLLQPQFFLQLIAGLLERTLILTDRILLQLKVRCRVESFEDRPAVVVSKFSTPAEASRNADFASWICLLMDLILRVKLSLFSDSDTTRSRSVSLMPAHHLLLFLSIIWHLTNRKKTFILCINKKEEVLPCKCS